MNSIPEVLAEAQTQALGMVQPVLGEEFSLVAMPLSFNGERPVWRGQRSGSARKMPRI